MPMRREQVAAALQYLGDKANLRRRYERMTSLDQPQDSDAVDMALEMGGSLVPGVGQALAARDFERARRADDETGMALAAASAIPVNRLIGALKGFDPVMREIDVYHGSPHRFDPTEENLLGEFDASKIGTGEGAQAYGHGIYLAESPAVGRQYAEFLASRKNDLLDPGNLAASMMHRTPEGTKEAGLREIDAALKGIKGFPNAYPDAAQQKAALEKARELLESGAELPKQGGNLYTADLPDEMVDRMLDWDKPLGQQPAAVRETVMRYMNVGEKQLPADMRVGQIGDKYVVLQDKPPLPGSAFGVGRSIVKGPRAASEQEAVDAYWNSLTGKDFYDTIGKDLGKNADASDYMRQLGIPGIKYLDAGSRGQGGSGTRNFVVFPGEEKKVKILKRE